MSTSKRGRRFERLLALIPFLQKNEGISLQETASLFGITEEQLISDLNLIWVCGLPGYSHLELIDVSYDSGVITIDNAETLSRPMRLTFEEGTTLLLAIESLFDSAPISDLQALKNVRKKLLDLLELPNDNDGHSITAFEHSAEKKVEVLLPKLLKYLEDKDQTLHVEYYSATLDDIIHYRFQPLSIEHRQGRSYLIGFSSDQKQHLNLRLDRIVGVEPALDKEDERSSKAAGYLADQERSPMIVEVSVDASAYWFIQKWRLPEIHFDQSAGGFVGSISVFNPKWLERATLSAAGALVLQRPSQARSQVLRAAQRVLSHYQ
jgi:predicted DNA-binding transcriptional regulator YafY